MNLLVIWNFSFDITKSSEIVSINESILILEIIGQCDIGKHDVTDKKNNVNLNVSTYMITSITARPSDSLRY